MLHHSKLMPAMVLSLLTISCVKEQHDGSSDKNLTSIDSARQFFETSLLTQTKFPNLQNYRARQPKTVLWNQASSVILKNGPAVVAPVNYSRSLYLSSEITGNRAFSLSSLTFLVIARDSASRNHASLVTYIPDSTAINGTIGSSGIFLLEDWQGYSLKSPKRYQLLTKGFTSASTTATQQNVETDVVLTQVCNTIDGYNYSEDDPGDGEAWTEETCTMIETPGGVQSGLPSPIDVGRAILGGRSLSMLTIQLAPPTSPISNIADYFRCFTQFNDAYHQYSVTLAVEQPVNGSRQPWSWTETGLGGSSAGANPFFVGHTYLIFTENSGGLITTRNVGFYPQSFVGPGVPTSPGVLGDDENTGYDVSLTVSVSSQQFFQMLNYTAQGDASGYQYNLNSNNCTTFALDAMDAGEVSIPATVGTWAFGGQGLDPGDLGEDIRGMQLNGNMTRSTVSNSHPNTGNCNP